MITHRSRPLLPFSTPLPSSTFVRYGAHLHLLSPRLSVHVFSLLFSLIRSFSFFSLFFSPPFALRDRQARENTRVCILAVGSWLRQMRTMRSYVRTNERANERMMNHAITSMTTMRRSTVNVYRIFVT